MTNPRYPAIDDQPRLRVACGIYRVDEASLAAPGLAGPTDELLHLIDLTTDPVRCPLRRNVELTVELWRGENLRDRFQHALMAGDRSRWTFAFRLARGASSPGSSRLIARILLDGIEVARSMVLLGRPDIDAQGRFRDGASRPASAQTLVSFEAEFQRLLHSDSDPVSGQPRTGPGKKSRDSA
ncbi:MAG TPA: hypothetical protein VJY33_19505 [Isosphaeraceae bacterium]|jgi:hypothetical protein|nr:hypothetical protein [Isosphaeraceae bacterium]